MVSNRPAGSRRGPISRRTFLHRAAAGVAAVGAGAGLLGCDVLHPLTSIVSTASAAPAQLAPEPTGPAAPTIPGATMPAPRPIPPAGRWEHVLQVGERWETMMQVRHSGRQGSTVMVLGGVHGNEPSGWLAAEELLSWEPTFGSLIVVPRANILPTYAMERTFDYLGDLNRMYPGDPNGWPMERMAASIVDVAREFNVEVLLDMHESWGFYVERIQNGTAFLGQTITTGRGPADGRLALEIAAKVNAGIAVPRDLLQTRGSNAVWGNGGPNQSVAPIPGAPRGSSSLNIGQWVPGLTSILMEMGQMNQTVERRVQLHLMVAEATLQSQGIL